MKRCTKKRRKSRQSNPEWRYRVVGWKGPCDNTACKAQCRRCQKARKASDA